MNPLRPLARLWGWIGEKWAEADTRAASAVAEPWWKEEKP